MLNSPLLKKSFPVSVIIFVTSSLSVLFKRLESEKYKKKKKNLDFMSYENGLPYFLTQFTFILISAYLKNIIYLASFHVSYAYLKTLPPPET